MVFAEAMPSTSHTCGPHPSVAARWQARVATAAQSFTLRNPASAPRLRGRESALRDLELHAPIERIAHVIRAGADDVLAETDAAWFEASRERCCLLLHAVLDVVGPLQGEAIVGCFRAGLARVADHAHARLGGRCLACDLAQPERVRPAHLRIGPELGSAGVEQE